MPRRFPKEFRDDVVWVTRSGSLTYEEIVHDFNISSSSLQRWLCQDDIDDGAREGLTSTEQEEVVRLRRGNRRLRKENEILRRAPVYFAKNALPMKSPLVRELATEGFPSR